MSTDSREGLAYRLYHGKTNFNFIGRRRIWFAFSSLIILAGLISLGTRGLNFGIDFRGGTAWEVKAPHVSVAKARSKLSSVGLAKAKIQILGGDVVRAEAGSKGVNVSKVTDALAKLAKVSPDRVSVSQVGPSWGKDISNKAIRALVLFLIAITLYISFRFELKMAVATLIALAHDLLITVGVYSIAGFQVTPPTVVAALTILGYSIYDTIVVFDKVEENTRGLAASGRMTYSDMVNVSMNQVLMRSLNTSITAVLPILSLLIVGSLILGATTLEEFALALFVGLTAGAYSSIFIASPLLAMLKEKESRYAAISQRLVPRGAVPGAKPRVDALTPTTASGARNAPPERPKPGATASTPSRSPATRPATPKKAASKGAPRPRKKGKRR